MTAVPVTENMLKHKVMDLSPLVINYEIYDSDLQRVLYEMTSSVITITIEHLNHCSQSTGNSDFNGKSLLPANCYLCIFSIYQL